MLRQIIHIDEEKCNGCGLCASACHEGAIDIIDGKAKLVRENFCDGFGDCLPGCPTGAITFEEREAPAYDEEAVRASQAAEKAGDMPEAMSGAVPEAGTGSVGTDNIRKINDETEGNKMSDMHEMHHGSGCPGSKIMNLKREETEPDNQAAVNRFTPVSRLNQWPCQIKLVPEQAPFFDGAKLLIAADCTAYAYANMHEEFMKGKITIIGCPKLDAVDYTDKLTAIIRDNDIKSVTIVRMEVPCCGGLQMAAMKAIQASGKFIPWQVVTISRDGRILD